MLQSKIIFSFVHIGPPSEVLATTTFAKHKRPDNTKKGTTKEKTEESDNDGKLGEEETKETGEVKSRVYKAYISALGNWLASTMVLSIIFMQGSFYFYLYISHSLYFFYGIMVRMCHIFRSHRMIGVSICTTSTLWDCSNSVWITIIPVTFLCV